MIDPAAYSLAAQEQLAVEQLLASVGPDPSLEQIWTLLDQAWQECGCDNRHSDPERYGRFYGHAVWLLNGMFIEQHAVSMGHRRAITAAVAALQPERVVDCGGGFGTLARLMAADMPAAYILIFEPYPPRHGIESCKPFANIRFVTELGQQNMDVLVSTDVLEHVPDPLALLAAMVASVRLGGRLLIANCFFPMIQCHLPGTFHLRFSFDRFCAALGLTSLGPCIGSHATIYRRDLLIEPDWPLLRAMERRSQLLFPLRQWREQHLRPWRERARLAVSQPLHYPRKVLNGLRAVR